MAQAPRWELNFIQEYDDDSSSLQVRAKAIFQDDFGVSGKWDKLSEEQRCDAAASTSPATSLSTSLTLTWQLWRVLTQVHRTELQYLSTLPTTSHGDNDWNRHEQALPHLFGPEQQRTVGQVENLACLLIHSTFVSQNREPTPFWASAFEDKEGIEINDGML